MSLAGRLEAVESVLLTAQLRSDGAIDLIQEGMRQAAVALSRPRRQSLAALVAEGITDADLEHVYKKRVLQLFGELSDAELLILRGLQTHLSQALEEPQYDSEFLRDHANLLYGPRYDICASIEELERFVRYESLVRHLVTLGLISLRRDAQRGPGNAYVPPFTRSEVGVIERNYDVEPIGSRILSFVADDLGTTAAA
jgi:hypothetical protein